MMDYILFTIVAWIWLFLVTAVLTISTAVSLWNDVPVSGVVSAVAFGLIIGGGIIWIGSQISIG